LKVKPMAVKCLEPARPVLLVLIAWFVLAQVCSSQAACLTHGARLAPDEIAKFQANPKAIFLNAQGGPAGSAEIISKMRDLVTTDKSALPPILEALKFAGTEEKSAIGTALGQVAQACIAPDAGYAAEIQEALATTTDRVAILAFAAVTGNVPIGATGGGAGAGGGGGAGGGTAGTGTSSGGRDSGRRKWWWHNNAILRCYLLGSYFGGKQRRGERGGERQSMICARYGSTQRTDADAHAQSNA
jgi:hypothetical protein